jgi:predicted amidohydrolase
VRAAAVQFKATKGDVDASRDRLVALADRAAAGADLLVLPEMAVTGYIFPDFDAAWAVAETPHGPTCRALADVARAHGCWIVCGFPERAQRRLYNAALVLDDRGELAFVYRKTLLFDADTTWATPGDSGYRRFRTRAGTFGLGICMDLNDPRFLYWVWRSRLDALAFPTNWVDEGQPVWPYWSARVGGSGAVLVAANTYGTEEGWAFSGRSAILRDDDVLASGPPTGDAVIAASF